ncbi:MAG: 50S ribosomal protein L22 [Cyclobacteriaceae bacterium]|nr:50S ribosomal protein L22 [Cyclobacteriaceae bacterium]MCH8516162.1 50S ribosomal protein L22 [Cyclobacteriaceae bacterium]
MENTQKLKKSVRIRLQKEELKAQKEQNAGRQGATKASLRNIPTSPRKMRLVADIVRNQSVNYALNLLKVTPNVAAKSVEKLLLTAIADWQVKNEDVSLEEANLYIKEIYVDSARILKRLRPAPQGRAHRIRKRSNHLTIVLDSLVSDNVEATQE